MARNIGPELMADLERARPNMDPATYATRKLELEELIRKGKAIELSPLDRVGQVLLAGVGVLGRGGGGRGDVRRADGPAQRRRPCRVGR